MRLYVFMVYFFTSGGVHEITTRRSGVGKIFGTILKAGWKLLGDDDVIKAITKITDLTSAITNVASITQTVTLAINGCAAFYPDLNKNWKTYEKLDGEFRQMSDEIDGINSLGIYGAYNMILRQDCLL